MSVSPISSNVARHLPPEDRVPVDPPDTQTQANTSGGTQVAQTSAPAQAPAKQPPTPQSVTDAAAAKVASVQSQIDQTHAQLKDPKLAPGTRQMLSKVELPELQQSLGTAQTELKKAIDAEITSKVGANATPDQVVQTPVLASAADARPARRLRP